MSITLLSATFASAVSRVEIEAGEWPVCLVEREPVAGAFHVVQGSTQCRRDLEE
jgi:hypothetical protein